MNTPIPHGLSVVVRNAALPIRDELVKAGWTFGPIHWDHEGQRRLAFSVKSPGGVSRYVSCEESALGRKLQELMDSN